MSCCPPVPSISIGAAGDEDIHAQDTGINRGESVECYVKRAGNDTGQMDDKTEHVPNKILNTDIPLKGDMSINVIFKLTPNSTRSATSWQLKDENDNVITNIGTSVTFADATLSGTFAPEYQGKSIKVKVTALDGLGEIDTRAFIFSPAAATGSNEIRFLHPLPGARVTSPFGPRRHPITKANTAHGGADFAHAGGKITEVLAAADGEVVFTGTQSGGAGNYIKIKHLNGAGQYLCTTVYMHLSKFYVASGQKVVAGQKIGLEGNTGVGTGSHLHFECRLPNGTKIDPVPLIRGSVQVAGLTNPDNTPVEETLETQNNDGMLTSSNVRVKEVGCEEFGPEHPPDPTASTDPLPSSDDPFEAAWFFTMQHEVGPHWTTSSPADPEVAQGLIETQAQRRKVGYVNTPSFPGGETKFGIAQGPNPNINVRSINYANAKKTGYNNYWQRGPSTLVGTKRRTAIALFDLNYLHGVGNANYIKGTINLNALSDDEAVEALIAAQQEFIKAHVIVNPQRTKYLNGWLKRSNDLLEYVKGLS